ncbi:MAG: folylpolyglutamate synthase/dihydrofolate synthase family protein [Moraxellaceae bacterium]|nr:folylpolyglutamate synthase/dihydrofolate synthase family protein [Moraxellaceae bacterium]MDZ4387010.1 folylpolyglutamate synthase/dihydrofolate synthase family protein [Moraxellaceae bacterium]
MTFHSVPQWLDALEQRHPVSIDLGLDRVGQVADRLLLRQHACPVITVAGTNGKGSTVTTIAAIAQAAGLRVATYTSPHLVHFNERIRCNGVCITDEALVQSLNAVDGVRGEVSLTYFEHTTLAALHWFKAVEPDLLVLEVGLGGRLDAVNLVDPSIAVITNVDLDHQAWLGDTRAEIAREKAGIMRADRPVILGELSPDQALFDAAAAYRAGPVYQRGRDFDWAETDCSSWQGLGVSFSSLPSFSVLPENAATALAAISALNKHVGVVIDLTAIQAGLGSAFIAGRAQRLEGLPATWLDVGHNPHGVKRLWQQLGNWPQGKTHAVFAMLADKDIDEVIRLSLPFVDIWHVANLPGPRAFSADSLAELLQSQGQKLLSSLYVHDTVAGAMTTAKEQAQPADRIVVFGSFLTVSAVLPLEDK